MGFEVVHNLSGEVLGKFIGILNGLKKMVLQKNVFKWNGLCYLELGINEMLRINFFARANLDCGALIFDAF
jgi:hypothetical protein